MNNHAPTVDVSRFTRMCRDLSGLTARPFEPVLRTEVGKILEGAMKLTKVAKSGLIRNRFKVSRFVTMNGGTYYLGNLYPDDLWAAIQIMRKESLAKKLKARGLARQSWWALGQGVDPFEAPAYVVNAVASTDQTYPENTTVTALGTGRRFVLEIENAQPTAILPEVGGEQALQKAMRKRMSFFHQNVNRKVFDNMANIAKKYPGIMIRRA